MCLGAFLQRRFEAAGGRVLERTPLAGVTVHPDGVSVQLGSGAGGSSNGGGGDAAPQQLTAALLLDSMGHASPVVQQVRWGRKPDGICLVVGSCSRGFDPAANTTGDVIFTNSHSQPPAPVASSSGSSGGGGDGGDPGGVHNAQLFWEAFPASTGPGDRTTYLFTYVDAEASAGAASAMALFCACMPDDHCRSQPHMQHPHPHAHNRLPVVHPPALHLPPLRCACLPACSPAAPRWRL